jgi:nucleolin
LLFSIDAAVAKDRSKFMGRPLKIYYCPPRPGDIWPPPAESNKGKVKPSATSAPGAGGANTRPATEKPAGCVKLFAGNLSYDIDDDAMVEFFKDCGELVGLRWLTKQDTGEFRGCGFVQFATSEECDKAKQLDGTMLLGRPIRLDYTT